MFTANALYREFWDIDGDGTFDKTSPSHFESTLTRTASGWELRSLLGTVKEFDAAGRWVATRDRNGNITSGTYASGSLTQVHMPDGRRLDFVYHGDGLVASITEVGVDGVTARSWGYTWSGQDLTRIDRPDGTSWLFRYDDPSNPGYVTRRTLRGTDGSERIDAARQYDRFGNLIKSWRGDVSSTGPRGDRRLQLQLHTAVESDGEARRRIRSAARRPPGSCVTPAAIFPWRRAVRARCSSCGTGPNSQQFYDDAAHPTRVTRSIDAKGTVTLFEYDPSRPAGGADRGHGNRARAHDDLGVPSDVPGAGDRDGATVDLGRRSPPDVVDLRHGR